MELNAYTILLILAAAAVSYLPRVIPAILISKVRIGPWLKRFLAMIPYTAMTSLVFPGAFYSVQSNLGAGTDMLIAGAGIAVAVIASWFKLSLGLIVVLAVLAVLALIMGLPLL